jgi:ATP-dependent DNA helicase RecG
MNDESESVEFKPSLSQMKNIVETISAFSSTKGGKIEIGRKDYGGIVGVKVGKNTIEKLASEIKQNTDPHVYPSIQVKEMDGKMIIVIEVRESKTCACIRKSVQKSRENKSETWI